MIRVLILLMALLSPSGAWAFCDIMAPSATFTLGSVIGGPPCGSTGGQFVDLRTLLAGENQALNLIYMSDSGTPQRYTSTGDKNVVTGRATESVQITAWSGTSVTAIIYDTASGACNTGTQLTGTISLTNGTPVKLGYRHTNGFCVTIGGTSPDVTVSYR